MSTKHTNKFQLPRLKSELESVINDIQKDHHHTNLVFFIGSGFSSLFDKPLWNQYAARKFTEIISEMKKRNIETPTYATQQYLLKETPKMLLSICDILVKEYNLLNENHLDENHFEKIIFSVTDEEKRKFLEKNSKIISLIEAFSSIHAHFITTNYDNVLEKYFGFQKNNINDCISMKLLPRRVTHIHGDIEDGTAKCVSSLFDYYDKYYNLNDDSNYIVSEILKKFNVIFLGYSMQELEIMQSIMKFKNNQENSTIKAAIVCFASNIDDDIYHKLYEEMGVKMIYLDTDESGYDIIIDLLIEWAKDLKIIKLFESLGDLK